MAKPKIGRPRSEKSKEAILKATHSLLTEKDGAGLTIEAIARRAEVGKPTIYRWWPSMADIVLEVLLQQADAVIEVPEYTSLRASLSHFLKQSVDALTQGSGVHLRFLMANAQQDEAFRQRFRDNFVAKRREVLLSIFGQAIEIEQVECSYDPEMLVDMVFGAMWYRLLTGHAPLDEAFADDLVEIIIKLVQPH